MDLCHKKQSQLLVFHQKVFQYLPFVEQALQGETIAIARRGVPVVTLEPIKAVRPIGLGAHLCENANYSDWELFSDTNPDVYEENPHDPLNIVDTE